MTWVVYLSIPHTLQARHCNRCAVVSRKMKFAYCILICIFWPPVESSFVMPHLSLTWQKVYQNFACMTLWTWCKGQGDFSWSCCKQPHMDFVKITWSQAWNVLAFCLVLVRITDEFIQTSQHKDLYHCKHFPLVLICARLVTSIAIGNDTFQLNRDIFRGTSKG